MITPSFGLTATERVLPRLALDWTTGLAQPGVDVVRAGTATYVDSDGVIQLASADTQRIDYSTGTAGLLVEESRTNLITSSNNFSDASYSLVNASLSTGTVLSPDGSGFMTVLTGTGANSGFRIATTVTAGVSYRFSFWSVRTSGSAFAIALDINDGAQVFLGAPTVLTRQSISIVAGASGNFLDFRFNAAGSLNIFGFQLEAGAFATSYIPTSGSAVTRNADVATMTGTNFSDWFNASEGTFAASVIPASIAQNPYIFAVEQDSNNFLQSIAGSALHFRSFVGGTPVVNLDAGTFASGVSGTIVASYKLNNFAAAIDGGAPATTASGTLPTPTTLYLGAISTAVRSIHLQKFYFYPQRLTNAEVQSFSKG
jgi:hypothetical protein